MKLELNNTIFVDVMWFGTVGIVLVQDNLLLEYKAYIKDIHKQNGPSVGYGIKNSEEHDIADIIAWGNTFPMDAAKVLFSNIIFDETKTHLENNPEYAL